MVQQQRQHHRTGVGLSSRPTAPTGRLPGYRPNGYRNHDTPRAEPVAPTPAEPARRLGRLWARVGRFPSMVGGMVLGALIPWSVNAYAPHAVETVTGTPVVQVTAGYDQNRLSDGWTAALPRPVKATDVPATVESCPTFRAWAVAQQAADVEVSWLILTFRGTRLQPVNVTGVRVVVDSRTDVYSGSQLQCASAGSEEAVPVGISLDENNPVLREVNDDGSLGAPWFSSHTVTLSRDELVTFAVRAYAFKAAYTWHLEAVVRTGAGDQNVIRVPGSYATTGVSSSYHDYLAWRWDLQPQQLVHSTKPDSI